MRLKAHPIVIAPDFPPPVLTPGHPSHAKIIPNTAAAKQRLPTGWTFAITWLMAGRRGWGNHKQRLHFLNCSGPALFNSGLVFISPPPYVHRFQMLIPPRLLLAGCRWRHLYTRGPQDILVPTTLRNPGALENPPFLRTSTQSPSKSTPHCQVKNFSFVYRLETGATCCEPHLRW